MSTMLRMVAWAWMMAGLLAIGSFILARMGTAFPVPAALATSLSLPWSWLVPFMGVGPKLEVLLMAVGVFINAQILFVIANVIGD